MRFLLTAAMLAGVTVLSTAGAQAQTVVFNTFGKGGVSQAFPNSARCLSGADTANCGPEGIRPLAFEFSPGLSGTLDYADVAICSFSGFPGAVVALVDDHAGAPTPLTNVLETFVITKTSACTTKSKVKLASKLHPALTVGSNYWFVLLPLGYDSLSAVLASPTATGHVGGSPDGGLTWNISTAPLMSFEIFEQ
jgi:hypothetical protein